MRYKRCVAVCLHSLTSISVAVKQVRTRVSRPFYAAVNCNPRHLYLQNMVALVIETDIKDHGKDNVGQNLLRTLAISNQD